MIEIVQVQITGANPSGNIVNPGRRFFLKLASQCIREVKKVRDLNSIW
jgi:hypothetical protein